MSVAAETPAPTDNFEAAFAMLTSTDESKREEGLAAPAQTPVADPPATGDSGAAPESTPTTETPPVPQPQEGSSSDGGASHSGEPAAPAEGVSATPAAGAAPAAPAAAQPNPDDEILNRLAELVRKPAPQAPVAPTPAPTAPPASPEPPAEIYSDEEKSFLADYDKEWGDVSKGEALKRRAEYQAVVQHVFTEIGKQLGPLLETVQELATRTHLSDLKSTVTDYDDVRDKVVEWVETQPTYLQVAYKHVINEGTVEEVADLIQRFKASTGTQLAAPAAAPAPAAKKETALPPAAKQAAASLAPVSSKRSGVVAPVNPDDFDGAFAVAAKDL